MKVVSVNPPHLYQLWKALCAHEISRRGSMSDKEQAPRTLEELTAKELGHATGLSEEGATEVLTRLRESLTVKPGAVVLVWLPRERVEPRIQVSVVSVPTEVSITVTGLRTPRLEAVQEKDVDLPWKPGRTRLPFFLREKNERHQKAPRTRRGK